MNNWTIYKTKSGYEIHTPDRIENGEEVCDVIAENVSLDNARLISAAPDLYKALNEVRQCCENFGIALPASTAKRIELALAKSCGEL